MKCLLGQAHFVHGAIGTGCLLFMLQLKYMHSFILRIFMLGHEL